jgi:hypothetical protein
MTKVKVYNVLPESEQEQELSSYLTSLEGKTTTMGVFTSAVNSGFGTTFKVSHFITVISSDFEEKETTPSKQLVEVKTPQGL